MENIIKGMLIVIVVLYVISPVDFMPGPIDDLIAVLLGAAANKKLGSGTNDAPDCY
jgi:hypothetical protein